MVFLYFNCKRTNLDQVLSLKVKAGSIEDKSLKMTLGPYGLNVKDMVLDLNKLLKSLPEGLEIYIQVYLFKDLSFILIPKGVSVTTLFFLVFKEMKKKEENIFSLEKFSHLFELKTFLICLKLKVFLENEIFKAISVDFNPKNGEIIDLRRSTFSVKDLKCLLGTLGSFNFFK